MDETLQVCYKMHTGRKTFLDVCQPGLVATKVVALMRKARIFYLVAM